MRADVQAEHAGLLALQKLEGPRPKPLPDWPKCPNCGEQYGVLALRAHTQRCVKLLPHGANGYGPQDHARNPKFAALYAADAQGTRVRRPRLLQPQSKRLAALATQLKKEMMKLRSPTYFFELWDKDGNGIIDPDELGKVFTSLNIAATDEERDALFHAWDVDRSGGIDCAELCRALGVTKDAPRTTLGTSMSDLLAALGPSEIDRPTLERLRTLFDRFDENRDHVLSMGEFGVLMTNCFPTRCLDAEAVVAEFSAFDRDGSGTIDFEEFSRRYAEMREAVDPRYDEACAMFDFFDADGSQALDPDEFLSLLNQIFPEHCEQV